MAARHNFPGNPGDAKEPTHRTIHQAVLTTPCEDHRAHTIVLSSLDDYAQVLAHWVAAQMQRHGHSSAVSDHRSDRPASDINPRDEYFAAMCEELARLLDDTTLDTKVADVADGIPF